MIIPLHDSLIRGKIIPMGKAGMRLFMLWMIIFIISSCSPAKSTLTPSGVNSSTNQLTLTVWLPEQDNGFYSKLSEKFEQENPDVNVLLVEIPKSEYVSRIDEMIRRGKGPDIALLYNRRWLARGNFLPLDREMNNSKSL